MFRTVALVAIGLLAIQPVEADKDIWEKTTEKFLNECESEDHGKVLRCKAYIEGWLYGSELGYVFAIAANSDFLGATMLHQYVAMETCFPEEPTVEQIQAVFIKWAKANPQLGSTPKSGGLLHALQEAYPCEPIEEPIEPIDPKEEAKERIEGPIDV